ncbi:cation-translocating P-type ATPase [Mycoplasma sp. 3686d]|uniref:cation-translocating P-type ATPase n=1 Tax=Mycoplasma sp. 3686d TaxID=2967300 RepID=UPI00211CA3BA|nr:cation-translocating P-type ATPase [Mycoplasma sp. 3686d]UUM24627.1 cation-translocating P-type ATPase [Mycoplasma sp. 3686d]
MDNQVKTDLTNGLTDLQVLDQQAKYGFNEIKIHKKFSFINSFLAQFKDFMIILLLIAATVSFAVAIYHHASGSSKGIEIIIGYIEPTIILIVVILNSMLGTYQEYKSDQAVRTLEKNNQLNSKVIRNGKMIIIPANEIVPGDLVVLEAGDYVPADGKLIEAFSLNIVESALTGESLPVAKMVMQNDIKSSSLGDQLNRVFSGTYVTNGRGIALIEYTGNKTELGKINKLINQQEIALSPLQIKLNNLSRIFGISGVVLFLLTTLIQILLNGFFGAWSEASTYSDGLVIGISLAVAAIPEGLITFTTVLLAIGVANMTKQKAIIKSLPSIESLGSTQVICTDKTGTLTENKMQVVDFWDYEYPDNEPTKSKALFSFIACCDAQVHLESNGTYSEAGDPTETAILRYGIKHNQNAQEVLAKYPKLFSLPFDSDRKSMSVLIQGSNGKSLITKGAPDVIFSKCNNLPEQAEILNEEWSRKAYRVIAIAYKLIPDSQETISHDDENQLNFLGLIALVDPPRESVKESIEQARQAGIKTVMITGDHLTTAVAIAKELNIYQEGNKTIKGEELALMSDEELRNNVHLISVYARVNPSDKLRIVKAWQYHDKVVAMTGDGVNDAPALKAAEVGCAMGITGTEVSKQAADVILTDDNFNTIVNAVKSGRETYKKVKTVILNLLISSVTEIIVMLFGLFLFRFIFKDTIGENGQDGEKISFFVLSASQLLWVNLLTHGLPAIALGMTPSGIDVMKEKPINKRDSVFASGMGKKLLTQSFILSFFALLAYLIVGVIASKQGIKGEEFVKITATACFVTLGIGASLNSINLMSSKSIFKCSIKEFYLVYVACSFSLICVLTSAYIPGFAEVFKNSSIQTYAKSSLFWIIPLFFGFGLIAYNEIAKALNTYVFKREVLV